MPLVNKIVEVSRDALGWCLIYTHDVGRNRMGDPVCDKKDVEYYKTRAAALRAAKAMNETVGGRS